MTGVRSQDLPHRAFVASLIAFSLFAGPAGGAAPHSRKAPHHPARPAPDSARAVSDVRNSPGYVPLHDPDSMDVILGRRRNAPLVSRQFHGGPASLKGLGESVCRVLHKGNPDSLLALCVKSDEFREILWPEFPQSRPATGLRWDDGWQILWGRLNGGSVSAMREHEDHTWTFQKLEYLKIVPYRNFRLYNNVKITAKNEEGMFEVFTFIRSIAERKGRFRIYSMSD